MLNVGKFMNNPGQGVARPDLSDGRATLQRRLSRRIAL